MCNTYIHTYIHTYVCALLCIHTAEPSLVQLVCHIHAYSCTSITHLGAICIFYFVLNYIKFVCSSFLLFSCPFYYLFILFPQALRLTFLLFRK